jgi:hypothetical protein
MMNSSIKNAPEAGIHRIPAGQMQPGDCMLDESMPATRSGIVTKMIRRLNRLLGYYSIENEGKLAIDIISLIEHGIKKEPHNELMVRPFVNKLATGKDILKHVYLGAKNITLEFGMLIREGNAERDKSIKIAWVLRMELKILEGLIGFKEYDYIITEEMRTTAEQFVKVMRSDIDKFCEAHGIEEPQPNINPPPSTTSPE